MLRPAPRFTLFPYTTLFRSKKMSFLLTASGPGWIVWTGPSTDTAPSPTEKQLLIAGFVYLVTAGAPAGPNIAGGGALTMLSARSEEHTSELQSLRHLVCRLLLEKKKNKIDPTNNLYYALCRCA